MIIATLLPEIYSAVLHDRSFSAKFGLLLDRLRPSAQLSILQLILLDLPIKYPSIRLCDYPQSIDSCTEVISGAAAFVSRVIGDRSHLKEEITKWLAKGKFAAAFPVGINRVLVANYTNENGKYHISAIPLAHVDRI